MKLNCEAGKLAIMVTGKSAGKVFTTLRLASREEVIEAMIAVLGRNSNLMPASAWWKLDTPVGWGYVKDNVIRYSLPYCTDGQARKLEDPGKDVEDEMVSIMRKKGKLPCQNESILAGCSSSSF